MAKLTPEHREFIIDRLAMHDTPTMVSRALKETFGIDVPRNQVEGYDPRSHRARRRRGPSPALVARFEAARAKWAAELESIPIADRAFRVRRLQAMFEQAFEKGNHPLAARFLEQAAKEMGETFSNTRKVEHSGKVQTEDVTPADKREMLAARFSAVAADIAAEAPTKH